MNRRFHRVVFNAARQARVVVQETAKSAGKATGSTTAVLATTLALLGAPATAQVAADPLAPGSQRPTILAAPNGVPLINITTPSPAGVSINQYRQFDVQSNGAILNNAVGAVQSQLGGYVQGNPWLATGGARIIVNQVNSSNPSYLRGYLEVAGQRAEVIIANPSGIAVSGGGFINASRATLTTGTPQFNTLGGLDSFLVRGGTITIDGAGLDLSRTDYAAILARAVNVNAGIWASDLKVVTGANQVSADHSKITPTSVTGAAPVFALDVAALGGMYAGKITLIGTEAGLGVRNAGTLIASSASGPASLGGIGQLVVTSAGRLENTGTIQASADATLSAQAVANSGTVTSGASLDVATQGDLINNLNGAGGTLEGQRVELSSAAGDLDNRHGTIRQSSYAGLTLTAPALSNTNGGVIGTEPLPASPTSDGTTGFASGAGAATGTGTGTSSGIGTSTASTTTAAGASVATVAPGTLSAAGTIRNDDSGHIYASGPTALQTPQVTNAGGSLSVASLAVSGPGFSNAGGMLNVGGSFSANVGSFDNNGGQLHAGSLNIATAGELNNTEGRLISDADATLSVGGQLTNKRGVVSAGGALSAHVAGALGNSAGTLIANQGLSLSVAALDNTSKGSIQSVQAGVQLSVANLLTNTSGGAIGAATDLSVQAGSLGNAGSLRAGNDVAVAVSGALTNDGTITAGRHTTIAANSVQSGSTGVLGAGIRDDGSLSAAGDLKVTATNSVVASGTHLASGNAMLQGASVDLLGSQTNAANIALIATQGNVRTSHASVVTPGTLAVTANAQADQLLVNDAGTLNAGQLSLNVASLANTHAGQIVQTGAGATIIAVTGALNNDGGRIASNGQDLAVSAGTLTNTGGRIEHAGAGAFTVDASTFSGTNGLIAGNGALVVHAGEFTQDGGTTSARSIAIHAQSLSNQGGEIVQTGAAATTIAVSGALNNTAGRIASNGQDLTLQAGSILNTDGRIEHAGGGTLALGATRFDGAQGAVIGNSALVVDAGSFSQDGGIAAARSVTIDAQSLSNRGGQIVQTGAGATRIGVAGALQNDAGRIASNGEDLHLMAGTLANAGGQVEHAGSGTLHIEATTFAGANGAIVGNAALVVHAGEFIQDGGSTSARSIAIDAQSLSNRAGGQIVQTGTGATRIMVAGALANDGGIIASNGQDLSLAAASFTNAAGSIQHAGAGTLGIDAGSYSSTAGAIAGNGALRVAAGQFHRDGGSTSARSITIDAQSLSNRAGGQIVQSGTGVTRIGVAGELNNSGGSIASNGDTTVVAGSVVNQGGALRAAGTANLNLTTSGGLYNTADGVIGAGGNATIHTGTLSNDAGRFTAVGDLALTAAGAATNLAGTLAANGHTALTAASLNNSRGTVAAVNGDLRVTTSGTTNNTSGSLQAAGSTVLVNGGLDNASGRVTGNAVSVDAHGGALGNVQGTLASTSTLDLRTGALNNDAGLIQSGGAMTVNTNGQQLSNANAVGYASGQGGIASTGGLTLNTGVVNNTAGFIGAGGKLTASTADFTNAAAGTVLGRAALTIDTRGAGYDNRGGQTLAVGNLGLSAGAVHNSGGLIRSSASTTVAASSVDNTSTLAADQGIEGRSVAIAAATLNNAAGAIRGDVDVTVTSAGSVNNAAGLISAGDTLRIVDPHAAHPPAKALVIGNAAGALLADKAVLVDAAALTLDGTLASRGDLSVAVTQDISVAAGARIVANHDLTLSTAGSIDNAGKLAAGNALTLTATHIDNAATGEMSAVFTTLHAAGTLTNRGLIDGAQTRIDAGTLNNVGTGRIYGDHVAIRAGTLVNDAEAVNGFGSAGTIAARGRLDIGAGRINNANGALIYSGGDVFIGGSLDADGHAFGTAATLTNKAATIEAAGNLQASVATLNNLNGGVTWTMQQGTSKTVVEYAMAGIPVRWTPEQVMFGLNTTATGGTGWPSFKGFSAADPFSIRDDPDFRLITPSAQYPFGKFATYYTTSPRNSVDIVHQQCSGSEDASCQPVRNAGAWYSASDPIWTTFGLTPPAQDLPPEFAGRRDPAITVGQVGTPYIDDQGAKQIDPFDHPVTQEEYDQWQSYLQAHTSLDAATSAFVYDVIGQGVTHANPTGGRMVSQWNYWVYTETGASPVLQTSAPARILAGGAMNLNVGTGTNDMSHIVAGGGLTVTGGTIRNADLQVDAAVVQAGVSNFTYVDGTRKHTSSPYDLTTNTTTTLTASRQEGNAAVNGTGTTIAALSPGQSSRSAETIGTTARGPRVSPIIEVPSAVGGVVKTNGTVVEQGVGPGASHATSGTASAAAQGAAASAGGKGASAVSPSNTISLVVRTTTPDISVPTASLFRTHPEPTSRYLVETDPRFANYPQWLSSDYLLSGLGLDPNTTIKRLGDGFYEQQLIRAQVSQLTGHRYLDGFSSDLGQYQALMDAGQTFALQYHLTPGIALTDAQMAQLTSDIVWLVQQTVTLPDGSTEQVLVPQVYARVRPGDVNGFGALLAGQSVNLNLTGDLTNSAGTIAGRDVVSLNAENIHNLGGRISGANVALAAQSDLNNIGGTIDAQRSLVAVAGQDIDIQTTTRTSSSLNGPSGLSLGMSQLSATVIDRVAGLYVSDPGGVLVASAGNDLNIVGAIVANAGQGSKTVLQAGHDVNIATVIAGRSETTGQGADNYRQESSAQQVGSTIRSGGNLSIQAGHDMTAQASTLHAGTAGGGASATLSLNAGNDLTLVAGQGVTDVKNHLEVSNGLDHLTSNASSSISALNRTTLDAGANGQVNLQSGADMTLAAVQVNANALSISAGGNLNLATQSTHTNVSQQHSDSDVMFMDTSDTGKKDQSTQYNLFNVQQLNIQAGGTITAQMSVRDSAAALAQQPGMAWIGQLTSDPRLAAQVNWQQVQEAHDKWDYNYSGLSPTGAAIVSIVVGALTAGAGTAIVGPGGGIVATGAVQAGVTALAQQATISFYNNTGDIDAVLADLGSSQSVKNLVGAIVTGGAIAGLGSAVTLDVNGVATPLNQIGASSPFMAQLGSNLINQTAGAVINTAIHGGSLQDNLTQAIANAFINTAAAQGAFAIGGWAPSDTASANAFARELAHAVLGCAAGAARAGSGDGCAPGAVGAVVGHLAAQHALSGGAHDTATIVGFGQVVGAVAGAMLGSDAASVSIAAQAAGNAVENNLLTGAQRLEQNRLRNACVNRCSSQQREQLAQLEELDRTQLPNRPPPGTYTLGLGVGLPLLGDVSFSIGASNIDGWDVGVVSDTPVLGIGVDHLYGSRLVGRIGYQTGSLLSNNGTQNMVIGGGFGAWGGAIQLPSGGGASGGSVSIGPQFGFEYGGQETRTYTLRQFISNFRGRK